MVDERPYRYQGKIKFDVPGVSYPAEAGFGSGGAGAKGSTPYGDWPITQFVPHTPKWDLEGFALNNIYGRLPDPQAADGQRSDIMLHLDPKGRTLDKIKSLGCLSVQPEDWPALRDEIISLQKQGYSLVAHVDTTGQVTIRQADGTTATPVSSASAFADATKAARAAVIRDLQAALAKAGFDPGKVDGVKGPQTTAAIKAFQKANGLIADGIVGPMTGAVLTASSGAAALNRSPADGSATYTPRLDADGNYVGSPNRLRTNTYPKSVTSADNPAYHVTDEGFGSLLDPRTATMMDGPMFDPVGEGPSPIQLLDGHLNENGGLHFSSNVQTVKEAAAVAAPVPMPGRPAALDAKDAPVTTEAPKQTIHVGKHDYTVGDKFDQGGFHYVVTPTGIEKSRIPTGEKTVLSGIIGTVIKEKVAEAAPGVKQALGNAATAVQINAGQLGEKVGGFFGGIGKSLGFNGAPANGVVVEHAGDRNGRPVMAVSGQPISDRAPPPNLTAYPAAPARMTSQMYQPASFLYSSPPIQFSFPKTLSDALAGTSYATVASTMDQHFTRADPVLESIHDKRETAQAPAPKPAPVSTSTVKPQGTGTVPVKEQPHPAVPAAKAAAKMDDVGHPTTWGDFTKTMQVPVPAPAKLVPPAQRQAAPVPVRTPSVVISSPTGVGSVSRTVGGDTKTAHAANVQGGDAVEPQQVRTVPQVKTLPPAAAAPPVMISQPTTKTAGAPVPAAKSNPASPIYVDKATGARLTQQTINVYDADTQQWSQRTVYRPVAGAAPATVAAPASPAQTFANTPTPGQAANDQNKELFHNKGSGSFGPGN